ncbi:GUN4 domain-containing protein [Microcystis aeruginosa]|uniref:Putative Serine/threonine kinase n=1 Tax=Microcystis aeruginosa PCC 9701 TaxID=721123 RepID=I4IS09_MICAE|nr:GUN4 domain-containing protein [Microcystis aeruginosa]CCI37083.1 putative Serine/threonine kinase [Microcystis aeruginosa PCC 9701]
MKETMKDVFICHASEDKLLIVEPLVSGLEKADITFWYDRAEIKWGDSITAKVNEGLRISRFVIVVLSEAFLNKNFPKRELLAVLNQEIYSDQTKVLPLFSDNKQKQKVLESLPLLNDKLYQTWNGNADTIIEALLPHLSEKTTLKFKDQKSVDDFLNRDKLISDKGVSYSKLRQLLEAQSWLEADQETIRLLYKATDKPEFTSTSHFSVVKIPNEALSSTELKRISDNDLIILDNLWKKYSHNKFGLSTQARIYEQEGEDYYAFANRVGWRKNGRWLGYNDLTWHLDAPIGHLPWLQGKKAYPTEKQMRDFHFSAWTLNLGDKHFAEDTFISVLQQKVISIPLLQF